MKEKGERKQARKENRFERKNRDSFKIAKGRIEKENVRVREREIRRERTRGRGRK